MLRTIVLHLQRIRYNIYVNEFRSRLTEFIDDERVGFVNMVEGIVAGVFGQFDLVH